MMKIKLLLIGLLGGLILSCGVLDASHKDYQTNDEPEEDKLEIQLTGLDAVKDCESGLKAFKQKVGPTIQKNCLWSSCHGKQTIGGELLKENDLVYNRKVILAFDPLEDPSSSKLYDKISEASAKHSGGNLSSILKKDMVFEWRNQEALCEE